MLSALFNLTKPRISMLFALTGLSALLMEGSLRVSPGRIALLTVLIFLVGGAANAFNQYFERDIDASMERTAKKRPLPQKQITPNTALAFAVITAIGSCALLYVYGNLLAALLGVGTILFYSFYYTLYLKPRTPYNIVIGGAAGATAPLIAWAAATGTLAWAPWLMFALIFMWTPPHFWALALCCRDDYAKVGMPMLPVVAGEPATKRQIWWYSLAMVPVSLSLLLTPHVGPVYGASAVVLGGYFLWLAHKGRSAPETRYYWRLFGFSILYIMLLFIVLAVEALWR